MRYRSVRELEAEVMPILNERLQAAVQRKGITEVEIGEIFQKHDALQKKIAALSANVPENKLQSVAHAGELVQITDELYEKILEEAYRFPD